MQCGSETQNFGNYVDPTEFNTILLNNSGFYHFTDVTLHLINSRDYIRYRDDI